MKKLFTAMLTVAMSLSLTGCFDNKFYIGKVVHKSYEPAKHWDEVQNFHGEDTPVRIYDDEDYKIIVQSTDEGTFESDTWYLSKEEYDDIEVGDKVVFHFIKATKHDDNFRVRIIDGKPQDIGEPVENPEVKKD